MTAETRVELSRRAFIGAGLVAGIGLGVGDPASPRARADRPRPAICCAATGRSRSRSRCRFRVPPVLNPMRSDADADYYEITQTAAMASILPGVKTAIWGYNGIFPGPTIVSRRGRHDRGHAHQQRFRCRRSCICTAAAPRTTATDTRPTTSTPSTASYMDQHMAMDHGHGGSMAGDTTDGHRAYTYPLDQRAAMLWYHDHRMDFTGPSVWRGLAGLHLVRDDEEDALRPALRRTGAPADDHRPQLRRGRLARAIRASTRP